MRMHLQPYAPRSVLCFGASSGVSFQPFPLLVCPCQESTVSFARLADVSPSRVCVCVRKLTPAVVSASLLLAVQFHSSRSLLMRCPTFGPSASPWNGHGVAGSSATWEIWMGWVGGTAGLESLLRMNFINPQAPFRSGCERKKHTSIVPN